MKRIGAALLLVIGLLGLHGPTWSSDNDDTILVQQIQVSIQNHRQVLKDMEVLTETLRHQSNEENVMDFPSMQDFIRNSLTPSETQLKNLFDRYRDEYGERAFRRLAIKYHFTDLLE